MEEYADSSMRIYYKDNSLKFKEIKQKPKEVKKSHEFRFGRVYTPPPADHPWRNSHKICSQYAYYSQREKVAPKEKELLLTKT